MHESISHDERRGDAMRAESPVTERAVARTRAHQLARGAMALVLGLAIVGCARGRRVEGSTSEPPRRRQDASAFDVTRLYQAAGLIAESAPIPYVGAVQFLAGASLDSTLVHVGLSLPNRGLTFVREGDAYQAAYEVVLELKQGAETVRRVAARETVRVASYKETTRNDESVIFQQTLAAVPGQYVLAITVNDQQSAKNATYDHGVTVPRLGPGSLSTPIPVHEASLRTSLDSLPRLIASPRATATFGRDSLFLVYVEAYVDSTHVPVIATVRDEKGVPVWSETIDLPRQGSLVSGTIRLPVSRIGIGLTTLVVQRVDAPDTVRTPIFVGFSDNLAIGSFEEMLSYLRYFTSPARLQALREAPSDQRGAAWANFLRETDPVLATPEHEGLRDYFSRIEQANERFREEGISGWITDRGMVWVTLGPPDQLYEQGGNDLSQRGRAQIWEYRQFGAELVFVDQTGFGRWKLTPGSEAEFQSIQRRVRSE